MAITINSTRENADDKTVWFLIEHGGTTYNWHGDVPTAADSQEYLDAMSDKLIVKILRKQYPSADVPQLEDKTALESFEAWIAGGAKNAELTETRITPAQPAVDAVMGERQKTVESSEEVTTTEIVEVDGKMVQKSVTNTVVTNTPETKEVPLFDEAGEEVGTTTVPVMESYEVSPAVEAVAEKTETVVTRAESVVEKVAWKDTAE